MGNTRLDILDQKWPCSRASDERGLGQSPGLLDTISKEIGECFFNAVELAAEPPWGILSGASIRFWWNRQVIISQYGRAGRAAAKWGEDTTEEDLPLEILAADRKDQNEDNVNNRFRDEEYYSSKEFNVEDIKVPLLSMVNWGGILLHLRGNMEGNTWADSQFK